MLKSVGSSFYEKILVTGSKGFIAKSFSSISNDPNYIFYKFE